MLGVGGENRFTSERAAAGMEGKAQVAKMVQGQHVDVWSRGAREREVRSQPRLGPGQLAVAGADSRIPAQ